MGTRTGTMARFTLALLALLGMANALELTPDNWDSCRWQDCICQVPRSLVRTLQINEASMGQTYDRILLEQNCPGRRCRLHLGRQAALRFKRGPWIPHHQVRRHKQP